MAAPNSNPTADIAPWQAKRVPSGKHLVRRALPWVASGLFVGVVGWGLWPKPIRIETGEVVHSPLTVRVAEEGKTRVRNRYVVAAPVAGAMRRVVLKPGDRVVAGQTMLATLEPLVTPLLDARTRAQAEAAVATREAARQQVVESLAALRAGLRLAEAERGRMRAVSRPGTLAEADRDRVEAAAWIKAAEVRAAEFSQQVSEHELAQARAALERPAGTLSNNLVAVTSPVSGRVLKVMQESATVVAPGLAILEVGDPTDMEIEAEILSRDAVTIRRGDAVEIDQWGGDFPLYGRVRCVEPAAFTKISALGVEEQRVMVLSDLHDLPAAAQALGDRYRVEVRVTVWHSEDVLVVPAGGLFRVGNTWNAFVYQNGCAHLIQLEVGHSDGHFTEVLSGLKPGDKVLLHPPDTVHDGAPVTERTQYSRCSK